MKCIYEIRYELQWESSEPSHWEEQAVRVLSGDDAQQAVDTARAAALEQHRLDDNGRESKCIGFRLRSVSMIAQAEL
jgi:hypothetical protein